MRSVSGGPGTWKAWGEHPQALFLRTTKAYVPASDLAGLKASASSLKIIRQVGTYGS